MAGHVPPLSKLCPASKRLPPPLAQAHKSQEDDGQTGSRAWTSPCLRTTRSTKRRNVANTCPYLTYPSFTSTRTALGFSCKQNDGMSRRTCHKHDPAPFALYNRSTAASGYNSDHKNHGQKKPGKRRSDGSRAWTSPCLRTTHSTKRSNVVSGKLFCRKIGPRICFADLLGFLADLGGMLSLPSAHRRQTPSETMRFVLFSTSPQKGVWQCTPACDRGVFTHSFTPPSSSSLISLHWPRSGLWVRP